MDLKEAALLSGIYQIQIGNKCYVGQSNQVARRIRMHLDQLAEGTHPAAMLQLAYDDRPDLLTLDLLEVCEPSKLITRERFWYDYQASCGKHMLNGSLYARSRKSR